MLAILLDRRSGICTLIAAVFFSSLFGCTDSSNGADDKRFDFGGFQAADLEAVEDFLLERQDVPMFPLPRGLKLESTEKLQPEGWEASNGAQSTIMWSFESPMDNYIADTFVFFH